MKFPQSMKKERPKPESRHNSTRQLEIPSEKSSNERRLSGPVQRPASPLPKLVTVPADEKDHIYINTDGSSESDTTDTSSVGSRSPTYGQIITTTNLLALSQALTLRPPSPINSFTSQGSYLDDGATRSMAYRPKKIEYGSSPQQPGAIPIPSSNNRTGDRLSNIPPPTQVRLAPDAQGKEIPPDAKWTKINRRLVSPEVLDQAHKRYEAYAPFSPNVSLLLQNAETNFLTQPSRIRSGPRRPVPGRNSRPSSPFPRSSRSSSPTTFPT